MKLWFTEIQAVDPQDNQLKRWVGPVVRANDYEGAIEFCENHGLGYVEVVKQLDDSIFLPYEEIEPAFGIVIKMNRIQYN